MILRIFKTINCLALIWSVVALIVICSVFRPQSTNKNAKFEVLKLKEQLKCNDQELVFEKIQYGKFWLLRNLFMGKISKNISCAKAITFTTTSDYSYLKSLPILIRRWQAPISLALYAPGHDFNKTMDSIQFLRNCLKESRLIRNYVSFHIYFPIQHMPSYEPLDEHEANHWHYNCNEPKPFVNVNRTELYKIQANLTFPINVGRNIARKAGNTYFIFACDIELIPSPKLVPQFLKMIANNISILYGNRGRRVFLLPIFEVHEKAKIPRSKTELKRMLIANLALPFHALLCMKCHRVPKLKHWLLLKNAKQLSIVASAKREGSFSNWEPLYISDNKEPMFDERVTWEHQHDKRIQCFAMCLLGYEFHVLHPAFLTHMPGIKRFYHAKEKYVRVMHRFIAYTIKPEYRLHYGNNSKCVV